MITLTYDCIGGARKINVGQRAINVGAKHGEFRRRARKPLVQFSRYAVVKNMDTMVHLDSGDFTILDRFYASPKLGKFSQQKTLMGSVSKLAYPLSV